MAKMLMKLARNRTEWNRMKFNLVYGFFCTLQNVFLCASYFKFLSFVKARACFRFPWANSLPVVDAQQLFLICLRQVAGGR